MSDSNLTNRAIELARNWLAKLLSSNGGGLYAFGYACSFVYLEVTTIFDDVVSLLTEDQGLIGFIVELFTDSITNMVYSFIWFVPVISYEPPVGIAVLAGAYFLFERRFREPLAAWIERNELDPDPESADKETLHGEKNE
ncbi:MAG: hypothetical protein GKR90_06330 [Pseudomonadales bacterium]|nr:hypothetical protein [Pseudomonadales bacterium]